MLKGKESSMMSRYFSLVMMFLLLCIAAPRVLAQSALHPLEGSYKVTVTPDDMNGPNHEYKDVFTFNNNETFSSEKMKAKGFSDGHYDEDSRRFGPSKFKAEIKSDKEGKMNYEGSADGTQITGTLTWTKANGDTVTYAFRGEPNR
jgi:hypothetical protein